MITLETIDHATLARLAEAGAVRATIVVGQPSGWGLVVQYGTAERAVAAKRGSVRVWRRFETLAKYLCEIGLYHYQVDAVDYAPDDSHDSAHRRPDAAKRMKRAHEAAAYDAWFRAQVQEALDEEGPGIPHEEVKTEFAVKRQALRERIAQGRE